MTPKHVTLVPLFLLLVVGPSANSAQPAVPSMERLSPERIQALTAMAQDATRGAKKVDAVTVDGVLVVAERALLTKRLVFRPGSSLVLMTAQSPIVIVADTITSESATAPGTISWQAPLPLPHGTEGNRGPLPATDSDEEVSSERVLPGPPGSDGRSGMRAPDLVIVTSTIGSNAFPVVRLRGSDGENGRVGGSGGAGADGAPGRDGAQSLISCLRSASDGRPGGDGGAGGNGGTGGRGGDGGSLFLIARSEPARSLLVDVSGGHGGIGGEGGDGGKGGRGGRRGEAAAPFCAAFAHDGSSGRAGSRGLPGRPGDDGEKGGVAVGVVDEKTLAMLGISPSSSLFCWSFGLGCTQQLNAATSEGSPLWGVVVASYDSFERAANESAVIGRRSLPAKVFNRNAFYSSIITANDLASAQKYLVEARLIAPDAYVAQLPRWCRNPRSVMDYIKCDDNFDE